MKRLRGEVMSISERRVVLLWGTNYICAFTITQGLSLGFPLPQSISISQGHINQAHKIDLHIKNHNLLIYDEKHLSCGRNILMSAGP